MDIEQLAHIANLMRFESEFDSEIVALNTQLADLLDAPTLAALERAEQKTMDRLLTRNFTAAGLTDRDLAAAWEMMSTATPEGIGRPAMNVMWARIARQLRITANLTLALYADER